MILVDAYDVLLLDLDGVVYRGSGAVPHAVAALASAAAAGVRLGFVTNNASRPPQEVAEHLARLGIPCNPDQVVTSAQVGADLLAEHIPAGSAVLAVGGPGVPIALAERGFMPVTVSHQHELGRSDIEIASSVAGVLQGFGPDVRWRDLAVAAYAVTAGAFWVATNLDRTIPRADGLAPGNGTLVDAVTEATGVVPPAAGKPAAAMMRIAAERLRSARPLAVGDRLDTDIRGARGAGIDSLLVLTGVSGPAELVAAQPSDRPTYVAADLRGVTRPLPRLDESPQSQVPNADGAVAAEVRRGWAGEIDQATAAGRITELLGGAGSR